MEEKAKFCESCGTKIEEGESFCTKCGKKIGEEINTNRNNNLNNKKMPVWAIILIIFSSVFMIAVIFSDSDESELSSEPNSNYNESGESSTNNSKLNTDYKQSESEGQKKEYKKNETVIYKGVKYSVINVKYSNGSDWDNPASGKVFVIVKIKIENTSSEKIEYNVYDWKMRNSQGQEDDEAFTTIDSNTNLSSGTLAVGGKKEGTIVFEEPKNDKSLKLLYFDNSFFDNEEVFTIVIK